MVCHDQEPLNPGLYNSQVMLNHLSQRFQASRNHQRQDLVTTMCNWNLRALIEQFNVHDRVLLLHSEQHSAHSDFYRQLGFEPVYVWSHALIAQDWYRYAQHDARLDRFCPDGAMFLIYNRAWSGSREYRLTFVDGLIRHALLPHCQTSFAAHCDGVHYSEHQWVNGDLAVTRRDIEQLIPANTADSAASADYDNLDYARCGIEVVLETLMDDSRWHLTEKALRPLACGRAFMLAATPGSLEYIRSYGFRTFEPWIREHYDLVTDTRQRIQAIQQEMVRLAALPDSDRRRVLGEVHAIAQHNRRHFFSPQFFQQVVGEYTHNLTKALAQVRQHQQGQQLAKFKTLMDRIPDRAAAARDRDDQLYQRITQWIRDPDSVPENW